MRRSAEELNIESVKYRVEKIDNRYLGYRSCPACSKELKYQASERYYLLRNIRIAEKQKSKCISCTNTGDGNPFFGKKHSEITKTKVSDSRKGKACGLQNSMANPENRQKVSRILKEKYDSGELNHVKKIQSDTIKANIKSGKLNSMIVSKPEKEIEAYLNKLSINVVAQFKLETYRYDLYIPEFNLLIEYNGDYWHCNPIKYASTYYNTKKSMTAQELWDYDKNKITIAKNHGYNIITIWESDYKTTGNQLIENLIQAYAK